MENPLLSPFHSVDISLYITICYPKFSLFPISACVSLQSIGLGSLPGLRGSCSWRCVLHPTPTQWPAAAFRLVQSGSSKSDYKQLFLFSLSLKETFFSFSFVHVQDHKQHMRSVKYSWQLLLFNCTPLLQPTAIHFIPNSAFYFELSEQWDENFALKMCSVESGYHMCMEVLRAWCLPTEQGNCVGMK